MFPKAQWDIPFSQSLLLLAEPNIHMWIQMVRVFSWLIKYVLTTINNEDFDGLKNKQESPT